MRYLMVLIALLISFNSYGYYFQSLRPVDFMDNKVLDTSVTNIDATKYLRVIASLAETCYELKVYDSTGEFIGVYTVASDGLVDNVSLKGIVGLGEDRNVNIILPKGHSVYLKSETGSAITTGDFSIQCLGL